MFHRGRGVVHHAAIFNNHSKGKSHGISPLIISEKSPYKANEILWNPYKSHKFHWIIMG